MISDELNHASIIDGIRLCKAQRLRYKNNDMADLEAKLQEAERRPLPADRHRRRLLDGRHHRQPEVDLRPGRQVRRPGDGRRLARRRLHGQARPGHARVSRRDGPGRHPHRHARQGPRRRQRRLHERPVRDRRDAPPAVAALPVLELGRPADPGRVAQGDRDLPALDRAARPARGEHQVLPRRDDRAQVQHHPRRAPDRRRS